VISFKAGRRSLAAVLLFVLCISASFAQTAAKKSTSTKSAPSAVQESQNSDLLDINSATKDQLATLPGIGAVYSQKILDGRPYRAKTDLVRKNILPQSAYSKIAAMIIARQPKSGTK
jgi:competence protein ComEA